MKTLTDNSTQFTPGQSPPPSSTVSKGEENGGLGLQTLLNEADLLSNSMITWRRHLHMHPEQAFHEHETSNFVFSTLSDFPGLELSRPTATSVLARLRGAHPGRTIAVRADIDALPITEENDVPYKSRVEGSMHACGHDGHTSIALALAQLLSSHREELHGEVVFVFQHAEELSPGGAEELVNAGVLNGVEQIIGIHLWAAMPVGRIGLIPGAAMAAPDTFRCTIIGRGGHAAIPHETVDPIAIGAAVVTALQHVVSRGVDPLDNVVVSVTQFIAGTTHNVIPESAFIGGTVRTFDARLQNDVPNIMERIIAGVTAAFGATYKFSLERGYRPVINDAAMTQRLAGAVARTFGPDVLQPMRPSMGGEDFSAYLQKVPGVFAFIGAGNVADGIEYPHHHPRFQIDEESLTVGLRYLTMATLELLA